MVTWQGELNAGTHCIPRADATGNLRGLKNGLAFYSDFDVNPDEVFYDGTGPGVTKDQSKKIYEKYKNKIYNAEKVLSTFKFIEPTKN